MNLLWHLPVHASLWWHWIHRIFSQRHFIFWSFFNSFQRRLFSPMIRENEIIHWSRIIGAKVNTNLNFINMSLAMVNVSTTSNSNEYIQHEFQIEYMFVLFELDFMGFFWHAIKNFVNSRFSKSQCWRKRLGFYSLFREHFFNDIFIRMIFQGGKLLYNAIRDVYFVQIASFSSWKLE